jgi:PiT family inorganic phosphate transporter
LLTWWWGLPTSSSHALIGGLAGAAIARAGWQVLVREPKLTWPIVGTIPGLGAKWSATLIFIVLAPLIGFTIGLALMVMVSWIFHRAAPRSVDKLFRKLQLLSAAGYSLGHGGNDAQKTMGIMAGALLAGGYLTPSQFAQGWGRYKWYIILSAHAAIALGTYFGGWRIVHTMGSKITKLKPVGGFCAEGAGAITLFVLAMKGIPVSTTHTITGAIVGVGSTGRLSAVRWGVAGRIVWAWILTIPAAAAVAAVTFFLIRLFVPNA